jgi:methylthioribulose-1-phosphate dehydratase
VTDPRDALAQIGRGFYERGWMLGTAGNLSARLPDGTFWVTASGVPKGRLAREHFVRVTVAGELVEAPPGARPSAETSLHQAIYGWDPSQGACLHVHTVGANLATRLHDGDVPLPPIEMVKGLGVWDESPRVSVPVFANPVDVPAIGRAVRARFATDPPAVPLFLIRDHGVTVWGRTLDEAANRVEIAAYLFDILVEGAKLGVRW